MSGDVHVRICEGLEGRFLRATRLLIFVSSGRAGLRVGRSVVRFLKQRLKLEINRQKSRIVRAEKCEYLGFIFPDKRIIWAPESLENFKYNIRRLTARSWGISMSLRLEKLSSYIRGWMNYYGLSKYYRPLPELDEWIRRRVRMCYLKQLAFNPKTNPSFAEFGRIENASHPGRPEQ